MLTQGVPIIKFNNELINLSHVEYCKVVKENAYDRQKYPVVQWKLRIIFRDKELTWIYDNETDANAALDKLYQLSQMYVIGELP